MCCFHKEESIQRKKIRIGYKGYLDVTGCRRAAYRERPKGGEGLAAVQVSGQLPLQPEAHVQRQPLGIL